MKITIKYIKSLKPCKDGLKEALKHYPNWEGSLKQMLNLKELNHSDKVWVFVRSIDPKFLPLVAADFAEEVLDIFEKKYPNDKRPRLAIEAARLGDKEKAEAASDAAYTAAQAAYDASTAAFYAAYTAAYTATTATAAHAVHAAYDASQAAANAAFYAAYCASNAAYCASNAAQGARTKARKKQIEIMKRYI